ncbi:MAG TPA: MFS transporter [Solirubrobacteraceae bacterium]|nr:MFS transporter [Solirubrobacteraceae bacterium]
MLEHRDGRPVVRYRLAIPYFGLLWRPLVARRARRVEAAAEAGLPPPDDVPWWAPPAPQDPRITASVAAICLISAAWSYGGGTGGLLTQTLPYAAKVYDVGDAALGTGLALVRIGVVPALILGLLADRVGRRRFVIAAVVTHCLLTAAIGLAPSFAVYIGAHVALRCLDTALGIALGVLAVESVPAANRAITLSVVLLANGAGLALAVAVLPLAAAGRGGFAAVYLAQLLVLPAVVHAGRHLQESPRYLAHAGERHGYREVLRRPYGPRLILVGGTALLAAIFLAPSAEFLNRYLDDVRGYSPVEIVLFLVVTGLPSVPMLIAGGRLSDTHGRKAVGVPLGVAAAIALAGVFLVGGAALWLLAVAGNMLGSAAGAALAPYRSELFPTRVRSGAGTLVLVATVAGSAIGLAAVGAMAPALGVGRAIATLAVFALLAALVVALRFPETARRDLDETSGEAPAPATVS